MNIRQIQFLAASCLAQSCEALRINNRLINLLLRHQVALSLTHDLEQWDRAGSALELGGRGDPMPDSFLDELSASERSALLDLIEVSVEVGIHDLYGSLSDRPNEFLRRCLKIAAQLNARLPSMKVPGAIDDAGWGSAVTHKEVQDALSSHPALRERLLLT